MYRYLVTFLLIVLGWGNTQAQEEPEFYKVMKTVHPNVYVVDSLYEIYRSNTPNSLTEAEIKAIKADKKSIK